MNPIEKLKKVLDKKSRLIIGLMSGMSLDGVDLALVNISGEFPNVKIELINFKSYAYDKGFKMALSDLKNANAKTISEFNFKIAYLYSDLINSFLKENNLKSSEIDAIGSHGQTIYHNSSEGKDSSTLQIGSGNIIAQKTGIITVSNFRDKDMAVGGQGAPLVPYVDFLLFHKENSTVALNNLGSISNLSIITNEIENIIAFDTGPANMPIDYFASQVPGNESGFDINGSYSKKGRVLEHVLKEMLNNPYFKKEPPKAAGYQEFGPPLFKKISSMFGNSDPTDLVTTAVEFSARTISDAYKDFILPKHKDLSKIIFTGGGSKNSTLISRIKEMLPGITIESLAETNTNLSTYKEALSFAVLANETLSGRPTNVRSATGANEAVILGQISI